MPGDKLAAPPHTSPPPSPLYTHRTLGCEAELVLPLIGGGEAEVGVREAVVLKRRVAVGVLKLRGAAAGQAYIKAKRPPRG